jgi:hypothetical protein
MQRTAHVLVAIALIAGPAAAQDVTDVAERLRNHLPARVADEVLQRIAEARAQGLPAAVLEHGALELVAKEVPAGAVARSVDAQARGLAAASDALARAGVPAPTPDEVEAGADAMARGVDGQGVAQMARAALSGQSLAVPLIVLASLIDRGLPSDAALTRVRDRLQARASVTELTDASAPVAAGRPATPGAVGLGIADAASAGARGRAGPPVGVPAPGNDVPRPVDPRIPERPSPPGRH